MINGYFKIIWIFLIVVMLSCNDNNKSIKDNIRNEIKINSGISVEKFKLVKTTSESAFGDYSETFTIKFDSIDFQNIVYQIKKSKYYDSNFNYNSSNIMLTNKNEKKRWIKMPFGYKFEYLIDKTDEMLQYEVGISDYTIDYTYIKE